MNDDTRAPEGQIMDQERERSKQALEAAIAANPGQDHYYFNVLPNGKHVQVEPTDETSSEPFLKRFKSGSQTRRNFNKTVTKVGLASALAMVLLKSKSALAYQCRWRNVYRDCLANNCTNNNWHGTYMYQAYECCTPQCHDTGSYRWEFYWCGC